MCAIIHLPAGAKIDFEKLKNCVHNNWHSYGLVTKIDGKLDIRRVVPKSGEVDPEEVAEALEKDEEFERFLHLRHNTAGATTLKNCHPFDVYYSEGRQVVFMHNGTFGEYKPKRFNDKNVLEDDPNGPSDSITFAEENITPLLVRSDGDIEDAYFQKVIRKFWSGGNRGCLISSNQDAWFIGDDWKTLKLGPDKEELKASNDLYFDKVVRGPEKDRIDALVAKLREEEKAKRKDKHEEKGKFTEQNRRMSVLHNNVGTASTFQSAVQLPLAMLKDFDFTQPSLSLLSESTVNICNDWDVYDREHLVSLACLTKDEWEQMYQDKTTAIFVMDYLSSDYGSLYAEHRDLEEKLERQAKEFEEKSKKQEKHIQELALKLKGVR